ncbi:MAG: helix-turn-helix domain-containing protein [Terrisporobacter sp.]|uniref:TrmB family transcriptional regulator n=1 Tax=Terrisporobacter sp. TaxID=1965305 RepID=UPI002FCC47B3
MLDEKISLLNRVGLTDAEAKVYLTLVKHGSLSGYEGSKLSGVPRSKIYNTLESLTRKGFALFSDHDGSIKYAPVPMEEISAQIKHETTDTLDELELQLKDFGAVTDLDYIWHIKEYKNVIAKCRNLIKKTTDELLLQIWEADLPQIIEELKELEEKGIQVGIVYFSESEDITLPFRNCVRHGMLKQKYEEMGGRFITLVSDKKEVVFGQILSENVAEVIWTKSRPMISMAAECVRHDIYFYKSANIFQEEMQKELGDDYSKIREIF